MSKLPDIHCEVLLELLEGYALEAFSSLEETCALLEVVQSADVLGHVHFFIIHIHVVEVDMLVTCHLEAILLWLEHRDALDTDFVVNIPVHFELAFVGNEL